MPTEISQTEQDNRSDFYVVSETIRLIETESRLMVTRGWGWGGEGKGRVGQKVHTFCYEMN